MSTVTQKSMELNTTRCSSRSSDKKKEWCERCIFQAIRLHNLIDYDVKVSDGMEVTVTARLRGVIPPEKLKEMKRQSNEESNK